MKEERKIDFKRHTSPPVSKMYLLKVVFYVLMLGVLSYFLFKLSSKKQRIKPEEIKEISNIQIGQ